MRGDKEQKCLELVKQKILMERGCQNYYFGLLEQDRCEIEQILKKAKPNTKKSEFPDFILNDGFIEHFQVSSSKENRKGAEHIKEMNCFESNVNKEIEALKQEWNKVPCYDAVRSKHWILGNPEHSHSLLIKSFKGNWENHINSVDKYTSKKDTGIFLIEYSDYALEMIENVYRNWINGMSQGDMRKQEKLHCYRLTRDRILLEYVHSYKNKIKYVIFVYSNDFEIIRVENIPYLLKLIPWEYIIQPKTVKNISSLYNRSVS